jgi:enterochelin esterase family protein
MTAKLILPAALLLLTPAMLKPAEEYALGPDSQRQAGVPQGKVTKHTWSASKIFPGTVRDYWVYVPAQYRPGRPASFMVFQDGGGFVTDEGRWRAHIVFDNLIHKRQMPPTIGIFINPGVLPRLRRIGSRDSIAVLNMTRSATATRAS